jgi:hypothetical protein
MEMKRVFRTQIEILSELSTIEFTRQKCYELTTLRMTYDVIKTQ